MIVSLIIHRNLKQKLFNFSSFHAQFIAIHLTCCSLLSFVFFLYPSIRLVFYIRNSKPHFESPIIMLHIFHITLLMSKTETVDNKILNYLWCVRNEGVDQQFNVGF